MEECTGWSTSSAQVSSASTSSRSSTAVFASAPTALGVSRANDIRSNKPRVRSAAASGFHREFLLKRSQGSISASGIPRFCSHSLAPRVRKPSPAGTPVPCSVRVEFLDSLVASNKVNQLEKFKFWKRRVAPTEPQLRASKMGEIEVVRGQNFEVGPRYVDLAYIGEGAYGMVV